MGLDEGRGYVQVQAPRVTSGVLPRRATLLRWSGSWGQDPGLLDARDEAHGRTP
jgi:hypothetical protein